MAGGHGTRLRPLTATGNKHMLPIANKPMLLYGLEQLRDAGIEELAIILGPIKEGVAETIGDGSRFGIKVTYLNQPEPRGLAHAVQISEGFMNGEPFVMYLGDNLLKQRVGDFVKIFEDGGFDCVVGVSTVKDPTRFAVAEMHGDRIVRLTEKPREPKSNLAVIGVYVFGSAIFDAVRKIKLSLRNELEITDAIQMLLDDRKKVKAQTVSGWWKDTGRPEDLLEANQLVLEDLDSRMEGTLSEDTQLSGRVAIGLATRVSGRVTIRGPAIIGQNCKIGPDVYIGPYTSVGDGCTLKNVEIQNSIIMGECMIETGKRITDSLIGSYSIITNGEAAVPQGQRLIIGERSFAQI